MRSARTISRAARVARLQDEGALAGVAADEGAVVAAAALLHDVGHYPFSHALEEIGVPHHEEVSRPLVTEGEVAEHPSRRRSRPMPPERIYALICGASESPLQGLISGSLDLDKMDYLKRDALMCGVPYGEIDEDRLMHAMVLLDDPTTRPPRRGSAHQGVVGARIAAVRQVPDVPERVLAPRRAQRDSDVQADGRAGARGRHARRRGARALHRRGASVRARQTARAPKCGRCSRRPARAAIVQARIRGAGGGAADGIAGVDCG